MSVCVCACARARVRVHARTCSVAQSWSHLCDPMDCSPPSSSVHGILQARTLKRAAISRSGGTSRPRDGTSVSWSPAVAGGFFATAAPGEPRSLLHHQANESQQAQLV